MAVVRPNLTPHRFLEPLATSIFRPVEVFGQFHELPPTHLDALASSCHRTAGSLPSWVRHGEWMRGSSGSQEE
jgi:hypothetical protein